MLLHIQFKINNENYFAPFHKLEWFIIILVRIKYYTCIFFVVSSVHVNSILYLIYTLVIYV